MEPVAWYIRSNPRSARGRVDTTTIKELAEDAEYRGCAVEGLYLERYVRHLEARIAELEQLLYKEEPEHEERGNGEVWGGSDPAGEGSG